jgi:hypothetical protein
MLCVLSGRSQQSAQVGIATFLLGVSLFGCETDDRKETNQSLVQQRNEAGETGRSSADSESGAALSTGCASPLAEYVIWHFCGPGELEGGAEGMGAAPALCESDRTDALAANADQSGVGCTVRALRRAQSTSMGGIRTAS